VLDAFRMAHKVEDLPLFNEAQKFCVAVTDVLGRSRIPKGAKRYLQIADASDSILANMDEGFEQASDDGFSRYLFYSKGSIAEVMRRMRHAAMKNDVSPEDVAMLASMAEPLGKMVGGFIKYLKRSGFKDRGRFLASQERKHLPRRPPVEAPKMPDPKIKDQG
jgi:four helix bundle protein